MVRMIVLVLGAVCSLGGAVGHPARTMLPGEGCSSGRAIATLWMRGPSTYHVSL